MEQHNNNTIPGAGFLRLPDVLDIFPVSRSAWWAGIKTGKYPRGVKLSVRTTAWRVEDLRELISTVGEGITK
jgi:predicted DNA-binding transcriptional regulator AlpA